MKIAVASEGKLITDHFVNCENINFFDIENNEIIKAVSMKNPEHKAAALPKLLNNMGVDVVIAGGIGKESMEIFKENNIKVVTGVIGVAEEAVKSYINGELQ